MNRLSQRALATSCGFGVLLAPVAAQTPAPAAPAAPRKLISPQRGDANIEITKPDTKVDRHRGADGHPGEERLARANRRASRSKRTGMTRPVPGRRRRLSAHQAADAQRSHPGRAQDAEEPEDEHEPVPVHARQRLGEAEGGAEAGRRARDELDLFDDPIGECRDQRHSPRLPRHAFSTSTSHNTARAEPRPRSPGLDRSGNAWFDRSEGHGAERADPGQEQHRQPPEQDQRLGGVKTDVRCCRSRNRNSSPVTHQTL